MARQTRSPLVSHAAHELGPIVDEFGLGLVVEALADDAWELADEETDGTPAEDQETRDWERAAKLWEWVADKLAAIGFAS